MWSGLKDQYNIFKQNEIWFANWKLWYSNLITKLRWNSTFPFDINIPMKCHKPQNQKEGKNAAIILTCIIFSRTSLALKH